MNKTKINIIGLVDNNDPFYRYKMSKLIVEFSNGRTYIKNLDTIANELHRDLNLIIKFIKKKLGAHIIHKNGNYIITGKIEYVTLFNYIREFIEYFVLCSKCKLPETQYIFDGKNVYVKCNACSNIDNLNKTMDKNYVKMITK